MCRLRRYIKHSRQCFIGYSNTSNFVKNTPLRVVFSTRFSVFGYPDETLSLVFDILLLLLWFSITTLRDWLEKLALAIWCETKTNRDSLARVFPRFSWLHVFAWSFDWFGGFSSFLMIGRNDYFGFSDDTRLSTSEYMKVHIFELRRMIWRCDWSSQVNT